MFLTYMPLLFVLAIFRHHWLARASFVDASITLEVSMASCRDAFAKEKSSAYSTIKDNQSKWHTAQSSCPELCLQLPGPHAKQTKKKQKHSLQSTRPIQTANPWLTKKPVIHAPQDMMFFSGCGTKHKDHCKVSRGTHTIRPKVVTRRKNPQSMTVIGYLKSRFRWPHGRKSRTRRCPASLCQTN